MTASMAADRTLSERSPFRIRELTSRELLVLQLLNRGYTREQIAQLVSKPVTAIEGTEQSACAALGAVTGVQALEFARVRLLII